MDGECKTLLCVVMGEMTFSMYGVFQLLVSFFAPTTPLKVLRMDQCI